MKLESDFDAANVYKYVTFNAVRLAKLRINGEFEESKSLQHRLLDGISSRLKRILDVSEDDFSDDSKLRNSREKGHVCYFAPAFEMLSHIFAMVAKDIQSNDPPSLAFIPPEWQIYGESFLDHQRFKKLIDTIPAISAKLAR